MAIVKKVAAPVGDFEQVTTEDYKGSIAFTEVALLEQAEYVGVKSHEFHQAMALCAASCIVVASAHGSVRGANLLIEKVGGGVRANTLREWLEKFGPFRYDEKSKLLILHQSKYTSMKKKLAEQGVAKFATPLVKLPFWKWKKEAEYKSFNFAQELSKLIAKAQKIQLGDTKGYDPDQIDLSGLAEVTTIVPMIKVKVTKPKAKVEDEDGEKDSPSKDKGKEQEEDSPASVSAAA